MMPLNFLLAACLDPVQAALVLAIVLAYRGPQPVLLSGVAAALITETIMVLAADGYVWGELIVPRIASALIQAAVLLCCVRLAGWVAQRVSARISAWLELGELRPDEAAGAGGLEAVGSPGGGPQVAAWHMRGYAKRRSFRLHQRKLHRWRANQSTT